MEAQFRKRAVVWFCLNAVSLPLLLEIPSFSLSSFPLAALADTLPQVVLLLILLFFLLFLFPNVLSIEGIFHPGASRLRFLLLGFVLSALTFAHQSIVRNVLEEKARPDQEEPELFQQIPRRLFTWSLILSVVHGLSMACQLTFSTTLSIQPFTQPTTGKQLLAAVGTTGKQALVQGGKQAVVSWLLLCVFHLIKFSSLPASPLSLLLSLFFTASSFLLHLLTFKLLFSLPIHFYKLPFSSFVDSFVFGREDLFLQSVEWIREKQRAYRDEQTPLPPFLLHTLANLHTTTHRTHTSSSRNTPSKSSFSSSSSLRLGSSLDSDPSFYGTENWRRVQGLQQTMLTLSVQASLPHMSEENQKTATYKNSQQAKFGGRTGTLPPMVLPPTSPSSSPFSSYSSSSSSPFKHKTFLFFSASSRASLFFASLAQLLALQDLDKLLKEAPGVALQVLDRGFDRMGDTSLMRLFDEEEDKLSSSQEQSKQSTSSSSSSSSLAEKEGRSSRFSNEQTTTSSDNTNTNTNSSLSRPSEASKYRLLTPSDFASRGRRWSEIFHILCHTLDVVSLQLQLLAEEERGFQGLDGVALLEVELKKRMHGFRLRRLADGVQSVPKQRLSHLRSSPYHTGRGSGLRDMSDRPSWERGEREFRANGAVVNLNLREQLGGGGEDETSSEFLAFKATLAYQESVMGTFLYAVTSYFFSLPDYSDRKLVKKEKLRVRDFSRLVYGNPQLLLKDGYVSEINWVVDILGLLFELIGEQCDSGSEKWRVAFSFLPTVLSSLLGFQLSLSTFKTPSTDFSSSSSSSQKNVLLSEEVQRRVALRKPFSSFEEEIDSALARVLGAWKDELSAFSFPPHYAAMIEELLQEKEEEEEVKEGAWRFKDD